MLKKLLSLLIVLSLGTQMIACSYGGSTADNADSFEENNDNDNDADDRESNDVSNELDVTDAPNNPDNPPNAPIDNDSESWAIYWYLCGSDLETNHGCATKDLQEMMEIDMPKNVDIVIQTGGANKWNNDFVDESKTQRWLYDEEGLKKIDEKPMANMGSSDTLYDFLNFANTNYPADRVAVVFWNHGGGSVGGAAYDENYTYDSLDLTEMKTAFGKVWNEDTQTPAVDLIGFDACLMATVDVAAIFRPFANYLVASEETEPGIGWNYSEWIGKLANDPAMTPSELGIIICNTYYDACEENGLEDYVTLSVTDLSKIAPLLEAYEDFGYEALAESINDSSFFARFGREASNTESYGVNSKEEGYTNLIDLGHFARKTAYLLPSAQAVLDALDDCIVHTVCGDYRKEATGLSCFYTYDGELFNLVGYMVHGTGLSFKVLYALSVLGIVEGGSVNYLEHFGVDTSELLEYLSGIGFDEEEYSEVLTIEDTDWNGTELEIDDNGNAVLNLGPKANEILTSVRFSLAMIDEESDIIIYLGSDNDIIADWENGIFRDNFRGKWGTLDGNLVYMELTYEGDNYNLYSVPILLNGEEYSLRIGYDFEAKKWDIIGAISGFDDNGMASKDIRPLAVGDKITILWMAATLSGDDDLELYEVDTVTVTEDTEFYEGNLPDGTYAMVFDMRDTAGNFALSDYCFFDCEDGEIETYK